MSSPACAEGYDTPAAQAWETQRAIVKEILSPSDGRWQACHSFRAWPR